jgi:hypothetical protein
MPKAIMLVWSNPSEPSREDEYNKWYDSEHIPDVLKIPAFTGATRYKVSEAQFGPVNTPAQYIAIYEVDTDDLTAIPQIMADAFASGELPVSDVLVPSDLLIFEQASEHITR